MGNREVKAAVMAAPGRIEVREFPYPEIDADSMLLATEMCGVCGTDKHTCKGETTQYGGTDAETTTRDARGGKRCRRRRCWRRPPYLYSCCPCWRSRFPFPNSPHLR